MATRLSELSNDRTARVRMNNIDKMRREEERRAIDDSLGGIDSLVMGAAGE